MRCVSCEQWAMSNEELVNLSKVDVGLSVSFDHCQNTFNVKLIYYEQAVQIGLSRVCDLIDSCTLIQLHANIHLSTKLGPIENLNREINSSSLFIFFPFSCFFSPFLAAEYIWWYFLYTFFRAIKCNFDAFVYNLSVISFKSHVKYATKNRKIQ